MQCGRFHFVAVVLCRKAQHRLVKLMPSVSLSSPGDASYIESPVSFLEMVDFKEAVMCHTVTHRGEPLKPAICQGLSSVCGESDELVGITAVC